MDTLCSVRNSVGESPVWSAAELDAMTIEMLCGLVDDLKIGRAHV